MKKVRLSIILLLVTTVLFNIAYGQKSEKTETIKGNVVAQYSFVPCVWHPCAVWLVVKVTEKKQTKYLRVDVEYFPNSSLPNRGFPKELVNASKKWKFKAIRDERADIPLENFLRFIDEKDQKDISEKVAIPAWKLLSEFENEILPFGEILPNYRVKASKFEAIK